MKTMSKAKYNIITTLMSQLVATACGIIVPRIIIDGFGSAAYGITVSISQFLSYITLLEGGIGGVARAKLYGPLARGDNVGISAVYYAEKSFFSHVAILFLGYSVVLGLFFHSIAKVEFYSRLYIFALVIVISLATMAKYLGGLPNLTLIVADQKVYINNWIMIGSTIANTLLVFLLVRCSRELLWVKLGSSAIFLLRPLLYTIYVRKHYTLQKTKIAKLEQKWTGVGQHIAFFLHTNTDVVLLTLFVDMQTVAVYAIYNLVVSSICAITKSFSGSMEARFGELIARGDRGTLWEVFRKYQTMMAAVSVTLFGCTGILILPFIRLYTSGISDTDYFQPVFAMVLLAAEVVNCLVLPCASLPVAANRFRQTRWGAYGEATINILLSLTLIHWQPLLGVAIGTLVATLFRGIFYTIYSAKYILGVQSRRLVVDYAIALGLLVAVVIAGNVMVKKVAIDNYMQWLVCGGIVFLILAIPTTLIIKRILAQPAE